MKQVQRVTANYSCDLFGICSALYELGGLIVMHDASGCNSTYATHDEPRWYTMDSMIYISALEEYDMVLGNDQKLMDDVCECAEEKHPKFIAIFGSPIALMCGTDFPGLAHLIEERTGIPTFAFKTSGMYTYQQGARQAFNSIADRFCDPSVKRTADGSLRVNLLGVTPLDFSVVGNVDGLYSFCQSAGFEVNSCWAMGNTLEQLEQAGNADVNMVVSSTAIDAAKTLQEKYGTPYVVGVPIGKTGSELLAGAVRAAAESGGNRYLASGQAEDSPEARKILLIGEPVQTTSLRTCIENDCGGGNVKIICPLEDGIGILRDTDIMSYDEDDIRAYMNAADVVIADPIFERILDESDMLARRAADTLADGTRPVQWKTADGAPVLASRAKFIAFPQESYSGRQYRSEIPVYVRPDFEEWLKERL